MKQSDLIKAFHAHGCSARPQAWEVYGDDGKLVIDADGKIAKTYGVLVSISSTGSTAVRTVRESDDVDPAAVVREMRAELTGRGKATRARIRRERSRS